jgi:Helix-turn-helix of DDE superfamily endonuclease
MSGLDEEQLSELECRVSGLLEEPWDKEEGRPRELTLREALVVTCGYMRQNIIEDVWADIFGIAQSTISRYITFSPHLSRRQQKKTGRPQRTRPRPPGGIALVDGTLWPCWSWDGERAVVREIQDYRTWLADRDESGPHNLRFRARYRQPA